MTLEKFLIFGFAIAVMSAVAVTATNMSKDRGIQYNNDQGYKSKVTTMIDKTRP